LLPIALLLLLLLACKKFPEDPIYPHIRTVYSRLQGNWILKRVYVDDKDSSHLIAKKDFIDEMRITRDTDGDMKEFGDPAIVYLLKDGGEAPVAYERKHITVNFWFKYVKRNKEGFIDMRANSVIGNIYDSLILRQGFQEYGELNKYNGTYWTIKKLTNNGLYLEKLDMGIKYRKEYEKVGEL
jgi:hypothetical protein